MNEQILFQTISQLAIQFKLRDNLTDDEAIAQAQSFVQKMVTAAKAIAAS